MVQSKRGIDFDKTVWNQNQIDELDALFEEARHNNVWFFHGGLSGPLWFSPNELETEQKKGHFKWGAPNWQLRSPEEYLQQIDAQIDKLQRERRKLLERMK